MTFTKRPAKARGHANHGWLDTYYTFSFANYYDPAHMGFRTLRVMNEDVIDPGRGFPTHPHDNMEIVTLVLDGELTHQDSMGSKGSISAGEIQVMSAGTGITHSEKNESPDRPCHLMQIWIMPDRRGHTPRYQQRRLPEPTGEPHWQAVVRPTVAGDASGLGALEIYQDTSLYMGHLPPGTSLERTLGTDRYGWLHVLAGEVRLGDEVLATGDGGAIDHTDVLTLANTSAAPASVLLFDMP